MDRQFDHQFKYLEQMERRVDSRLGIFEEQIDELAVVQGSSSAVQQSHCIGSHGMQESHGVQKRCKSAVQQPAVRESQDQKDSAAQDWEETQIEEPMHSIEVVENSKKRLLVQISCLSLQMLEEGVE